jgi:hypothetical protein
MLSRFTGVAAGAVAASDELHPSEENRRADERGKA